MLTVDETINKYYEGPAHFARAWSIFPQDVSKWRKAGFLFREITRDGRPMLERYSKRGEIELTRK